MVKDSDKGKRVKGEEGERYLGSARDGREWRPTVAQMAALEFCQDRDYGSNIRALAKAIGIHHASYYKWLKTPAFVEWWKERLDEHFTRQLPRVYAAMFKSATTGKDVARNAAAAQKLFLQRFDKAYAPRSRRDVSLKGQMDVGLSDEKANRICDEVIARFAANAAGERSGPDGDHPQRD